MLFHTPPTAPLVFRRRSGPPQSPGARNPVAYWERAAPPHVGIESRGVPHRQLDIPAVPGLWPLTWPMGLTMLRLLLLPVFLWLILADSSSGGEHAGYAAVTAVARPHR